SGGKKMKLLTLYHEVLSQVEAFYNLTQPKPKAGRKPKISDQQITALFTHIQKSKTEKNLLKPQTVHALESSNSACFEVPEWQKAKAHSR
ncbi:MAG: hypothetical protein N2648_01725, partial [Aquificaceae bacterium]|nr:hypothetical protein [Aquificaceae bacterium]